jgi:hypothetical protein
MTVSGTVVRDELLSQEMAHRWRTDWKSLDLPATEKRLKRLYWLREFAELCGPEIPKSWREFLAREIDRGERRQAALVFAEEPMAEQVSDMPGQNPVSNTQTVVRFWRGNRSPGYSRTQPNEYAPSGA